ncbi:hypothetical protein CRENBAI_001662 [Crenichthys baileyi]|uniref:AF4/FMR2 C-terminal homology domain-containing protein n=1 Tax=Crenichthys baileyi TaxID=28760 RepID=A0AAV9S8L3_9TELE
MASQPSGQNEERNFLRRQAWEQRIQETSQTKELNPENVPLFPEPYKTNKGDELSDRIQRMLGSYEDVNNPVPFSLEALPTSFSQSDQNQPVADQSNKTLFHNQDLYKSTQSQKGTSNSSCSSSTSASSPNQQGHSSRFFATSLTHSQFSRSGHHDKKSEVFPDLRGNISLSQEMSAPCPDAKPLPVLHSCDQSIDMDTRDTFNMHQLQGSPDISSGSASGVTVCTLNIKLSPINPPPPQAKSNNLPSQTFPSLLSSKQAGIVMTQKPTAYVRPMDGQDQVVHKSPELKPSPEHYAPLPELINKTDCTETKITPKFLEVTSDEVLRVEDILREMTHSWPPLLTAIHTPTSEPSRSPIPAKEAELSSCLEEKNIEFSNKGLSHYSQQNSSKSFEAAHSSDSETTNSSESESSLESDSDSKPPESKLVKIEPDARPASHRDWQLGEWFKPRQQNSSTDAQTSKQTSADTREESKSLSRQRELTDTVAVNQQRGERIQDGCFSQNNSKKSLPDGESRCSSSRKRSKPSAAGCPDRTETALSVKSEELLTPEMTEQHFTDNPKVKSKTGDHKKDSSDTKRDSKRTKHSKHHKKAGSEVTLVLYGHCPSCDVQFPNPCCCSALSLAQPDHPSPVSPVRVSFPKSNTETKVPHKPIYKHSHKARQAAKGSWKHYQPPKSLLVKIDLSLLARVPQESSNKGIPSNTKRPALVKEKDEASKESSKAHKPGKTNKKSQNVRVETKSPPKKKAKLENKDTSLTRASVKVESSNKPGKEQRKAKKTSQDPATSKNSTKASKVQNHCSAKVLETSKEKVMDKDSQKHKKIKGKHPNPSLQKKVKTPKSNLGVPSMSQTQREAVGNRSLLRFDKRQYPVNHYIKEAKKLKHKADAEPDKLNKAFTYLEAAMFFVESGIAMEKDPQISMSSYTMFAETVELLKFVLKLKSPVDSPAVPTEKDFIALCLKCQSVLQMAMFRHKQKTAIKFSKTLTDHFHNFAQGSQKPLSSSKMAENPSPSMPSPASTSSGPSSNHSGSSITAVGTTVVIPQDIEQVAFSYVNITTLFLSAHDIWEQAEELALKGSGMLAELDAVMGPLSLISRMSFMIRYIRQGVNWLKLDSQKL